MKGTQAKTIQPEAKQPEAGPQAAGQRRRLTTSADLPLAELPGDELSPRARSAVMQLVDELDRLKDELTTANERVTELESMADEDPLVPVLNRRGFERELERTLAYVKRYGTTVTLVYLDLDDFKGVNDRYGHAGGDAALRHFAEMLLANVRRSDLVGRLGGDEFAILLHRADLNATAAKAALLAAQVAESPAPFEGGAIPLSVTWGAAELQGDDSVERVLERADKAMYEGKARRRAERAVGS